jgi:hypothetical protein
VRGKVAPVVAVFGEELIGGVGSPGTGGIEFVLGKGQRKPCGADGIDDGPRRFDLVTTDEEGGIAGDGFEEEPFVGFGGVGTELGVVTEMHADGADVEGGTRDFAVEAESDAFVGLKPQGQGIGVEGGATPRREEDMRGATELDADFTDGPGQSFAVAEVEGDTGPAPVIDEEPCGDVGLGVGVGPDTIFLTVGEGRLTVDMAGEVLTADGMILDLGGIQATDGVEQLDLFVADGFGFETDGRFHGDEGQDLEQMVLEDVTEGADFLVERAARPDAGQFAEGDLDMIDVLSVPERLEDGVGKPEQHDVLDGFLTEVMVDAKDLAFVGVLCEGDVALLGGGEVVTERFFDEESAPVIVLVWRGAEQAGLIEVLGHDGELAGGDREVEECARPGLGVGRVEERGEVLVSGWLGEIALAIVEEAGEVGPGIRIERAVCGDVLVDGLAEIGAPLVVGFGASREADDPGGVGEEFLAVELIEGRDEFAGGEIAAGTEDDDGAGEDRSLGTIQAAGQELIERIEIIHGMA